MIIQQFLYMIKYMGTLSQIRIRSCYSDDWYWPFYLIFFEVICNLIPLYCLTFFFSSKIIIHDD